MNIKRSRVLVLILASLAIASLAAQQNPAQTAHPRRIAVFGSSVANGTGDELGREGYTGRLREMLAPAGWEVLNQSRGGDNTLKMAPRFAPEGAPDPGTRYLLPVNPGYVLLGLSLGNEGIDSAKTVAEKDAVFAQFETGMRGFIDRSREHHIVPVVTLCYTRNNFTAVEYAYTRRMNLIINSWDVPSANFLGAVDDGQGKWVDGFWNDALHPNSSGHAELTATIVPSLFEALERGKPQPARSRAAAFARVSPGAAPLSFTPDGTMHPFAVSVTVRARNDGTITAISGATLTATGETKQIAGRAGRPPTELKITRLSPAAPFSAALGIRDGKWTYTASNGTVVPSTVKADGNWHQVVLSHYTARGETLLFVDGALAGTAIERLQPARFLVGGGQADVKDLLIYRSALNADEVAALHGGALLQASLEVYAPLADARFERNGVVENRAQSMTPVKVESTTIAHVVR